ncbi:MAG TPA: POTRA domain-containing protein [Methylibium sp.]|uniref:POTRA domain-containing protein n=1 Tax=Methylibium sp. TaxID=2067992 RepID=UPI002DBC42E6|nr:POTRA domain-containing protein [Methylibium sp.]HEU4460342.1 POTRA domain-containing protein [Methylibium sp.]
MFQLANPSLSRSPPRSRPAALPVCVAAALLALLGPAGAQTIAPSQVTPPSLRPPAPAAAPLSRPGAAETVPRAADDALDVQLEGVEVEGGLPALAAETEALRTALAGRRVTLGTIRERTLALEQAYAARGWFLVRVVLPPQRLVDGGVLRVVVVDGVIAAIDAQALPARVRAVVERTLAPLVGHRGLRLAEAERRLLLAGSAAGLRLRSTLAAGEAPGSARLVLDGEHRVASAGLRLGNTQPRSLGRFDAQASVALNGAFGAGERLYATLGSGRSPFDEDSEHGHLRLVGAGLVLPVGIDGLTLNPEFTDSLTRPIPPPGGLRIRGRLERTALRVALPALPTSDGPGLGGQLALEALSQRQEALDFGVDLNRDRYRVLRLGVELLGERGSASLSWSRGLGGRDADDARRDGVPLSRQGAEPRFDRLALALRATQPFGAGWSATVIGLAQGAFGKPLLVPEQFALSGPDALSAFSPGALPVDQGATLRAELSPPPNVVPAEAAARMSPYAFFAAGRGRVFEPTGAEAASLGARSAGFGLRAIATGLPLGVQLELARRFGAPDREIADWRVQFTLSLGL